MNVIYIYKLIFQQSQLLKCRLSSYNGWINIIIHDGEKYGKKKKHFFYKNGWRNGLKTHLGVCVTYQFYLFIFLIRCKLPIKKKKKKRKNLWKFCWKSKNFGQIF